MSDLGIRIRYICKKCKWDTGWLEIDKCGGCQMEHNGETGHSEFTFKVR